jgi:hypothetical protein
MVCFASGTFLVVNVNLLLFRHLKSGDGGEWWDWDNGLLILDINELGFRCIISLHSCAVAKGSTVEAQNKFASNSRHRDVKFAKL